MGDPLLALRDPRYRDSLELIREWEGEPVSAQEIRRRIPGFKAFKGIYKPAGSKHALWIRQTRRGVYPDQDPVFHTDGSWTYLYAPESARGSIDSSLSTNRGLIQCMQDKVPIGVFRELPTQEGKKVYRVLGLGFVSRFTGTHFVIHGEPIDETAEPVLEDVIPSFTPLEPGSGQTEEVTRLLRERRFSSVIRELYHERCSLCDIGFRLHGRPLALQAAHVIPLQHRGVIGDVRNGILLCNNHHALFDSYAWTFDTEYRVLVNSESDFRSSAEANHILSWEAKKLPNLPDQFSNRPAPQAIEWRLSEFERRQ